MKLGPVEIGLIVLAVMLLFGYRMSPDASRALGRSLRIFKGEMRGMQEGATSAPVAATTSVRGGTAPRSTTTGPYTAGAPCLTPPEDGLTR